MPSTVLDREQMGKIRRYQQVAAALTGRQRPLVTYLLLLANAAVFGVGLYLTVRQGVPLSHFLKRSDDPRVLEILHGIGASSGTDLEAGQWWRLLTLSFVHVGATHLLMNMGGVFVLGWIEEPLWGRARFLAVYLISGLAGSCALVIAHPQTLGAGASGAVWGLLTALAVWVVANRHYLGRARRFLIPLVFLVIALETASSFLPGVSAAAHFGGGAMGIILGFVLLGQMYDGVWTRALSLIAIVALPVLCFSLWFGARALAHFWATRAVTREAEQAKRIEQRMVDWMQSSDPAADWSVNHSGSLPANGSAPIHELAAVLQEAREGFQAAREHLSRAWAFRYPQAQRQGETLLEDDLHRITTEEWMVLSRALAHEGDAWAEWRLAEPLLRLPANARDRATADDMSVILREQQVRFQDRHAFLEQIGPCLDPGMEGIRTRLAADMEACADLNRIAAQCLEKEETWSTLDEQKLAEQWKSYKQFRTKLTAVWRVFLERTSGRAVDGPKGRVQTSSGAGGKEIVIH
jgi:rhomboid protease GluP